MERAEDGKVKMESGEETPVGHRGTEEWEVTAVKSNDIVVGSCMDTTRT
jgi:hypothetical protein